MYTQRIAIPVETDVLTLDLAKTQKFYFYDVDESEIVKESMVVFPEDQKNNMPAWLKTQEVDEIITGEIMQSVIDSFLQNHISVVMGAPALAPKDITEDYLRQIAHHHHNHGGGCGCGSGDSCETEDMDSGCGCNC
jgi:predicted Fe-Mo cluster-binding NifX family protein